MKSPKSPPPVNVVVRCQGQLWEVGAFMVLLGAGEYQAPAIRGLSVKAELWSGSIQPMPEFLGHTPLRSTPLGQKTSQHPGTRSALSYLPIQSPIFQTPFFYILSSFRKYRNIEVMRGSRILQDCCLKP